MDNGERLAKVEAEVDSVQDQLHDIKADQVRLWDAISKLRDDMDRKFAEQREYIDQKFAEQREYTERGFVEIRASLNEIRKEQARTTRWLVSLTIGYGTAILGMMAKMAGMF